MRPDGDPALDGVDDPPERPTRRRAALAALVLAAAASAAVLVAGLPGGSPPWSGPAERPLTAAEAERVAALRVTNVRDLRAGVRVTAGAGRDRIELLGWVDWARPLLYAHVGGPGAGADRGLVQATAATLLVRPDPVALPPPTRPPLVPPPDRWRLREPPAGRGLAAVRDLLLGLGSDRLDPIGRDGRWLRGDSLAGIAVDVLRAPLAAPSGDRRPTLWLDRDARLHRLTGRLPDGTPVTVDLERADRPAPQPVDALGGRAGQPRALTDEETDRLAGLPGRLRHAGGAAVTVAAPLDPSTTLHGAGTLSWSTPSAYLAVTEDDTGQRTLRRAGPGGVTRTEAAPDGAGALLLPTPGGLLTAAARPPADDLDRLIEAALRAGTRPPDRPALRIRADRAADRAVDVVEVPGGLRWWLDRGGLPHRLELRTGRGVWIHLDLTPAPPKPAEARKVWSSGAG
ncbi:hypothetical protein [Micromonospora schwarzwaldensis]|uniref:hypothetical protein n=1 Tax=Micromonospora sp. DSM 45708 TaxID=3111767 RepID=UPI0031D51891